MRNPFAYTQKGGKDWFISDAYDDNAIESIKDPEGGVAISMPTAIPSPFARIDLVKTAFINICKSPDLKSYSKDGVVVASRSDEKLVSDALDLAEIMFNIEYLKDKIKILVWDKEQELRKLFNASDMHRRLSETLQLYLDQDKESYNFDLHTKFYIIQCNNKTIGATSPATLFFATANDLTHAQLSLTKSDKTFDEEYKSLYERDPEFQKYLYLLFKANPLLKRKLTVIEEYLNKNLKLLDKHNYKLYQEINSLNIDEFNTRYEDLSVDSNRNNIIEVLGIGLKTRRKNELSESIASRDFIINSTKYKDNLNKPLVLQNGFNKHVK
jgi:hypothetical protein